MARRVAVDNEKLQQLDGAGDERREHGIVNVGALRDPAKQIGAAYPYPGNQAPMNGFMQSCAQTGVAADTTEQAKEASQYGAR